MHEARDLHMSTHHLDQAKWMEKVVPDHCGSVCTPPADVHASLSAAEQEKGSKSK